VLEDGLWIQTAEGTHQEHIQQSLGANLRLTFSGSNPQPNVTPFNRLNGKFSYLVGQNPSDWHTELTTWGGVRYQDLYPGIDLVIEPGKNPALSFDAAPGSQVDQIKLQVEGVQNLTFIENALHLTTAGTDLTLSIPSLATATNNKTALLESIELPKINQLRENTFEIQNPFVVNNIKARPKLQEITDIFSYSTLLGGGDWDVAYDITVDEYGSAYLIGRTASPDFPVSPGAFDLDRGQVDVFVAKLNADGSEIEYATFIGGSSIESGRGISVHDGIAYITGDTRSSDFPGATAINGENDIFLAALNRNGSELIFSKLIGGSDLDFCNDITTTGDAIYLTGTTVSTDFPAPGYKGEGDAYVLKLDMDAEIEYATLIGGSLEDNGFGIAIHQGEAYITGNTQSIDFPAPIEGYRGNSEAFLAKLDQAGTLVFARFLGGAGDDNGNALAVDSLGNSYLVGSSNSVDFPVTAGNYGGKREAFLAKYDPDGELLAARYLGGFGDDLGFGISLNQDDRVWVTGQTSSTNFPISDDAAQRVLGGDNDAFLTLLDMDDIQTVVYGSYLGGGEDDRGFSLTLDPAGNPIITGLTASEDFPTLEGALDTILDGFQDAFITKFNFYPFNPAPTPTPDQPTPTEIPGTPTTTTNDDLELTPTPTAQGEVAPVVTETPFDPTIDTPTSTDSQAGGADASQPMTTNTPTSSNQTDSQNDENETATDSTLSPDSPDLTEDRGSTSNPPQSPGSQVGGEGSGLWILIPISILLILGSGAAYWFFKRH